MPAPFQASSGDVRIPAANKSRETFDLFAKAGYTVLQLTAKGAEVARPEVPPLQDLFACPNELLQEFVP